MDSILIIRIKIKPLNVSWNNELLFSIIPTYIFTHLHGHYIFTFLYKTNYVLIVYKLFIERGKVIYWIFQLSIVH